MESTQPTLPRSSISHGFTLVELLVALAVLAVTLGIAVPAFSELARESRLTAATNHFVSVLHCPPACFAPFDCPSPAHRSGHQGKHASGV